MLGQTPYYHQSIRKCVSAFGDLFNNISIIRTDDRVGKSDKIIKVPIAFIDKQDFIVKSKEQSNIDGKTNVKLLLPRMGFNLTGINYNPERQKSKIKKYMKVIVGDNTETSIMFQPVPYKLNFELNIGAKTINDALQIIEQILPFFTPDLHINIKDNPLSATSPSFDAKVKLLDSTQTIDGIGSFDDLRFIMWTMNFEMDCYIYGSTGYTGGVITNAIVNFRDDYIINTVDNLITTYDVKPDPLDANRDDNYDYTETWTDNE